MNFVPKRGSGIPIRSGKSGFVVHFRRLAKFPHVTTLNDNTHPIPWP